MIALTLLRRLFAGPSRSAGMTYDRDDERWVRLLAKGLPQGRADWCAGFLRKNCESPIEREFAAAFLTHDSKRLAGASILLTPMWLSSIEAACRAFRPKRCREWRWYLVPQVRFSGKKRLDFIAAGISPDGRFAMAAVECDGRRWHAMTRWQAYKDGCRDSFLLRIGVPCKRFTGSEIRRNPFVCAAAAKEELAMLIGKGTRS